MSRRSILSRKSSSALSLAIFSSLGASAALAQTQNTTWLGPAAGNWSTGANWSGGIAPDNGTGGFTDFNVTIGTPAPTEANGNFTIDNLTVNTGGMVLIQGGNTLTVNGPTLADNGAITISNVSAPSVLNFANSTLLTGTGDVKLNTFSPDALLTSAAGAIVTQDVNHTIDGVGDLDAALVNNGTVDADANFGGHTLFLETNNKTNNNLFEATGGGILSINGITITQGAGGQIVSGSAGTVNINGSTIAGGTLSGTDVFNISNTGSGTLTTFSTLSSTTISTGTQVQLGAAQTLVITGATFTNNGTITVDTLSSDATVEFNQNTLLTGTGSIVLNDYSPNARLITAPGATVTQSATHTISGVGEIDAALVNNGIVDADVNIGSHAIVLQTNNKINNNLMEATGGGILSINGITITQGAGGQIVSGSAGTVNINGSTIAGGTLSGTDVFNISNTGSGTLTTFSTLSSTTISTGTQVQLGAAQTLVITGATFTNNGTITVDTLSSDATVEFNQNTLLTGTGSIVLNDYSPNARLITAPGATVTQSATHTISGVGEIDAALVNNGIVDADVNIGSHAIVLQTNNKTNNNLMEATGGGILSINGITISQSPTAKIMTVLAGGTNGLVNITNGTIDGGILAGPGLFTIVSNSTFGNLTISTGTSVQVAAAQILTITGPTLTNNGTITVDTQSSNAAVDFNQNTLLTGTGSIVLNDFSPSARLITAPGAIVTQSATHTISGVGEIDAALVNNGTVDADFNVGSRAIVLQTNNMTNNATMEGTAGGILDIHGITVTQNAGGKITAGSAGTVQVTAGGNIVGGPLVTTSTGVINIVSGTLTNVTIPSGSTVTVPAAGNLNFAATPLTINGTLLVTATGVATGGQVVGTGALMVNGDGVLTLSGKTIASTIGSVTINSSGILDLTTNKLVIPYGTPANDPVSAIATDLARGYNNGHWNGTGISSSTAALNPSKFAVGYLDGNNSADQIGHTVPTNVMFVQYTLAGDAFLENTVGFDDLVVVAQNFGFTGKDWAGGNFDYDPAGSVGFADLVSVAQNFGFVTGINEGSSGGSVSAAWQAVQATSPIPEPASIALLAAGGGLLARRRKTSK